MDILEGIITNGTELTFAILFVALLMYVMKTNDKREEQYRNTITTLSHALAGYEDLKTKILEIQKQLHDISKNK